MLSFLRSAFLCVFFFETGDLKAVHPAGTGGGALSSLLVDPFFMS